MSKTENKKIKAYDIACVAMMTALIVICSWICIPIGNIPVTLQTFAVCAAVGILGRKKGTIAILVYIILGLVGLPVFSFFKGGIGALIGVTGGYIIGFVFLAIVAGFITQKLKKNIKNMIFGFLAGLIVCYLFGSLWFLFVYMRETETIGFWTIFSVGVLPYIIPDLIKITLAAVVSVAVGKRLKV